MVRCCEWSSFRDGPLMRVVVIQRLSIDESGRQLKMIH